MNRDIYLLIEGNKTQTFHVSWEIKVNFVTIVTMAAILFKVGIEFTKFTDPLEINIVRLKQYRQTAH